MTLREGIERYWQLPAAIAIAGIAVMLSHRPEPLPEIIPEPKPDLVSAVVITTPVEAGEPIDLSALTETQYPLAWMPSDAVTATDPTLQLKPLAVRNLSVGTPLAANMLMANPLVSMTEIFDSDRLLMPVPAELSRMLPKTLPPKARVSMVYEGKVGSAQGVILSAIPVTRSSEGDVSEVTWFVLDDDQLGVLQRGLRLGRIRLALCREGSCPEVSLKRIPDGPKAEPKKATRASMTVGLS
jgi:hypothetical protein